MKTPLILAVVYMADLVGTPWEIAEEAVEEAHYKLQHEDDPAALIMMLTSAWYNYTFSPLGEKINSPGFFVASRVKDLRTPPLPAGVRLHLNPAQELAVRWVTLALEHLEAPSLESHQSPRPEIVVVRPSR